jgi:putative heme-binding domain-containing protein
VERGDASVAPALREQLAVPAAAPATLITALRTLEGLGALQPEDVRPFLNHGAEAARVHALQLADRWFSRDEGRALLDATLAAAAAETSPRVQIQFALSLGESRDPRAFAMLARYVREKLSVRWMDAAVLSSLHGRAGEMLAELLREPGDSAAFLAPLAQSIAARRSEPELARALALIAREKPETQAAVLGGLAKGRKNAPRKPLADEPALARLATLAASPQAEVRQATRALEDTFFADVAKDGAYVPAASTATITDESFRKFAAALAGPRDLQRGHAVFLLACATCHRIGSEGHAVGPDLLGQLGMAEEALLKDILLPNERIRPGYETTLVQTTDGAAITGILKDDGATSLALALPNGVDQVLLRKDVTGVRRLATSLMPSFGEGLSPADVASLLAWLKSQLAVPTQPLSPSNKK